MELKCYHDGVDWIIAESPEEIQNEFYSASSAEDFLEWPADRNLTIVDYGGCCEGAQMKTVGEWIALNGKGSIRELYCKCLIFSSRNQHGYGS